MDVPLGWQLAKLLVSIGVVLGLSVVAERLSTRAAGLLSGYPLGTAIALFFIGLEISPSFAAESAVHTLAGFSATLALGGGYLLCARRDGLPGVLTGTAGGLVAWAVAGLLLTRFDVNRLGGTLITLAAILIFMRLYRHVPEAAAPPRGGFSWPALALRAGLAAGIIFLITGLAHVVPSAWAGVMAAFPVTMYPFLVILHLTHGAAPVATVIKHYPAGLGSLLCYALCVSLTYVPLGLAWGTLAGFAAATLWLLAWTRGQAWWRHRRGGMT
ncbi:hypothetical protein [Halomonas elongata]|uniref:Uncharacterized protein n=2 Tax=Halomonas elongata TaxID=2746 RepID=E1V5X2_HALED|nr:hypothetical protein [Halomonas elongata]MBW5800842.1 hypothetical protein [Halomonas elongata]MDL4863947.1 hypothetical protein [Halomonas elongata]OBX38044.1 hypothetical protein A8U91_02424 [Halomonas elongata]RAW06451.1 hypothetical protein DKQ62_13865 [Halomonas elongata]WBF18473.1 hypothetical protein LM502_01870 [Halomonas elongata]